MSNAKAPFISATSGEFTSHLLRSRHYARAPRLVMLPSREAIVPRHAVSVPIKSAVGFMSSVVALEFPYGVRRGTPKVFDAQGLISVRERYSAADEFAFNLIERRTEENGQISTPFRCSEFLPFCIAQTSS